MPTLRELESWQTVKEAAENIGVTRVTLYRWLEEGRLRAARTRHGWIIDPESVEDLEAVRAHDADTARIERGEAEFVPRERKQS